MTRDMVRSSMVVLGLLAGMGVALADSPRGISSQPGPLTVPPAPGAVTGRQPLPPASMAVPRGQRTFARCNREALMRKLRGADRRHFVARCRLGYGYRLFRRGRLPPT